MFEVLALAGVVLGVVALLRANKAVAEAALLRRVLAERTISVEPAAPEPPVTLAEAVAAPPLVEEPPLRPSPAAAVPAFDLEQLLAQRWGVWLGSAALLLAGIFLVRTAIEQAWVGPAGRCALAGALGAALVAAAEWARRRGAIAEVAPPALAAGGVGVLFAAAYGAGPLYGLVPAAAGFVLLGAAGLAGLGLALRFGRLVGTVGLVASFATPALVGQAGPVLPGLFGYLLFVSVASWAVVRWTAWVWLGWAAALGGAGWVAFVAATASATSVFEPGAPIADLWAAGLFVPAAAAPSLLLLPGAALDRGLGRRLAWAPLLLLGLAGLALLSATKDEWVRAGLLLLAPLAMGKAWREDRLAWLPLVSAGLAVAAIWIWGVAGLEGAPSAVMVEGIPQAVLPRGWTLEGMLWPFIGAPALVAVLHAGIGLAGERMRARPVPWAVLTAAVPVAVLAVAYAEAGHTVAHWPWAAAAAALATGLVAAAGAARRGAVSPLQRAGVHGAGAAAALALMFAIVLSDAWLTVALSLLLPGLAWVEGAAGLPPLRRVALAVATVVLVRLLLNPFVLAYDVGTTPVWNGVLVAYGIPLAAFVLAANLFRRRAHDVLPMVLEAGAIPFGVLLWVLEVHHAATGGALEAGLSGFAEAAWVVSALWFNLAGISVAARTTGRRVFRSGAWCVGALAVLGGVGLLVLNPFLVSDLGPGVVLSPLIPAYLLPALCAAGILGSGGRPRWLLGAYAFAAALMFVSAQVRQAFHPGMTELGQAPIEPAELWAMSGAWLLLAAALLGGGLGLRRRPIRLAGLLAMALVAGKVFLVDMSDLDGLWRVLSFLGLGLSLIGLGALYRRFGDGPVNEVA